LTEIPCQANAALRAKIEAFAEVLKERAHELGGHGLSEDEFYNSGLFRGAIERVRGQFSASMQEKRDFLKVVLNTLEDDGLIKAWRSAGGANRHDYAVSLPSGRIAVIELKGCLDGNNTTIFQRPAHADEFLLWSVCSNPGADPKHNLWSGIHTRLGADIIERREQVDALVVWDMVCGTVGRSCPKLALNPSRATVLGPYNLPPPCLYLFPRTIPSPRNNPAPPPHTVVDLEFVSILSQRFGVLPDEVYSVEFAVRYRGADLERLTTISRTKSPQRTSTWTPIRRA
jgi:hypothetical protein